MRCPAALGVLRLAGIALIGQWGHGAQFAVQESEACAVVGGSIDCRDWKEKSGVLVSGIRDKVDAVTFLIF